MTAIRVLKWDVPAVGEPFEIPGIRVVHFGIKEGLFTRLIHVWTECYSDVDLETTHVKMKLIVYPTGVDFGQMFHSHIMSCLDDAYVWHLYQEVRP
jgi:hypothetical protein